MRVIDQYHEIVEIMPEDPVRHIALAARNCYKSEDKSSPESDKALVQKLKKLGHFSVFEFASATVRLVTDKGVTHELVRHRLASYAQESQRYCSYKNQVSFVKPHWASDYLLGEWGARTYPENLQAMTNSEFIWLSHCLGGEVSYQHLLKNLSPQDARGVLPNSTKTDILMKVNFRELMHVFNLRTSRQAHPQIRDLIWRVQEDFQSRFPIIFGEKE